MPRGRKNERITALAIDYSVARRGVADFS